MQRGLLVISHGSREAGWVSLVDQAVEAARDALGEAWIVEAAFLELVDGRLIPDGVRRLEEAGAERLLALPLFVSTGSTHVDEIGWALGAYAEPRTETELERVAVSAALTYGKPMDDAPEVVDVLLDRLRELDAESAVASGDTSLLLVAHGSKEPGFREAWEAGMASIGEQLVARGGYGGYAGALLQLEEVAEKVAWLRKNRPGHEIVALPLFLSEGYFTATVIPRELAGLACRYSGRAYMPHPRVMDWIVRQAREWEEEQRSKG